MKLKRRPAAFPECRECRANFRSFRGEGATRTRHPARAIRSSPAGPGRTTCLLRPSRWFCRMSPSALSMNRRRPRAQACLGTGGPGCPEADAAGCGRTRPPPPAAELPVKVRSGDGAVTLTGTVPSAYEAMIVYRAAQQTPGVREVIDRLEFSVPDEDHPNPLLKKARPEDLEPYLASQIRRHVGDLAHIDRLQVQGDAIDIHGTLSDEQDRERLLAILRSIPVLHGFRVEAKLTAE